MNRWLHKLVVLIKIWRSPHEAHGHVHLVSTAHSAITYTSIENGH